jgi:hypothetical protein
MWFLLTHLYGKKNELADQFEILGMSWILVLLTLYVTSYFGLVWYLLFITVCSSVGYSLHRKASVVSRKVSITAEEKLLFKYLGIYLLIRLIPTLTRVFPVGWDPSFHLIIADLILEAGKIINSWSPYENISLIYPTGSHLFLAFLAKYFWINLGQGFNFSMVLFTALTGCQVYTLARRLNQGREFSLYAGLCYLFIAVLGSIGYAEWGGLPNLIGMYFFTSGLCIILNPNIAPWKRVVSVTVTFLASSFVHHHIMVTTGVAWGWIALGFYIQKGAFRKLGKEIFLGLGLSAIVGAPYFLQFLTRINSVKSTGIGGFSEDFPSLVGTLVSFGYIFSCLMLMGILFYFNRKKKDRDLRVIFLIISAFLFLWCFFHFGMRTYIKLTTGRGQSIFTPSRFLTDAVIFLSLFPALFLVELRKWTSKSTQWVCRFIALLFLFNLSQYKADFRQEVPSDRQMAYMWIRQNTSKDVEIIDDNAYSSYATHRLTSSFPLPTSEYSGLAQQKKALEDISQQKTQPQNHPRRILKIVSVEVPNKGKVIWSHPSGLRIEQLN